MQADEATGGDVGRGVAEEVGEAAGAERVAEVRQADAPHGAEAGHEVLVVTHIVVRHFALSVGAAGEDAGDVGGERGYVPAAGTAVVRVRRGAYADVARTGPVGRVVSGKAAGEAEVRHLVVLPTGAGGALDEEAVEADADVLADGVDASAEELPVEGCARLVGQMVSRKMGDAEAEGHVEVARPGFRGLVREAVDEVDADVGEARLEAAADGPDGALGVVAAAEAAEVGVVEALHAEADAADGELGVELAEVIGGEVVGVGLQGDLAAG